MKDDFVFATPENKANAISFVNHLWTLLSSYGNPFRLAFSTAFDLFDPYTAEDLGIFSSFIYVLLILFSNKCNNFQIFRKDKNFFFWNEH